MSARHIYRLAALAAVLLPLACSSPTGDDHAGGGNRSPNAYGYAMVGGSGTVPLAGAKVALYNVNIGTDAASQYTWEMIDSTVTGPDGFFRIEAADSTVLLDQLAVVIEKDDYRAFSGYRDFTADSLSFDTVAVMPGKRITGRFSYSHRISDMQLVTGTDTISPFDTLAVTIGLVGTPYKGTVQPDSTFMFDYVPASSYKMEMVYRSKTLSLGTLEQMTLVGYTPFHADLDNLEEFEGEPYVYESSFYFSQDDTVLIHSRDFIMRYTIQDLP